METGYWIRTFCRWEEMIKSSLSVDYNDNGCEILKCVLCFKLNAINKWNRRKYRCSSWTSGWKPQALLIGLCHHHPRLPLRHQKIPELLFKIHRSHLLFIFFSHKESILITVKWNTLDLACCHWTKDTRISIQHLLKAYYIQSAVQNQK